MEAVDPSNRDYFCDIFRSVAQDITKGISSG